ncbi:MAG: helix-turn-helix domain-containing protein [Actinomycetes bacterium]
MDTRVYLDLLAREAAAVEFEGPLLEARAAGRPTEVIDRLDEAKAVALQVRALLEHRRRREAELSALFDTAGDLAGLRDLDSVLQAIVHRARQLLGTDVAYLSMNDPERGDTYMRVTEGSVSARFQAVRLAMGDGLGGLVAQTPTPYATANYFADERFRHTGDIDAAVTDEGLVSILGVPLVLGNHVIGVLYAANRTERPFAREDVALLCSLAAHAAVAIDNARLLDETRAAVAELSATSALLREHNASVERAAAAHDRLTELVLRGGGVTDVADTLTDVLGGRLLVLDTDGRQLSPAEGDWDAAVIAEALEVTRSTGRAARHEGLWAAPVSAGSEHLGCLVLADRPVLPDADQRILERAALVTALLLLFRRSSAEAESRVRGELVEDLLAQPPRDPDALRERARLIGADLDVQQVVVTVDTGAVSRDRVMFAAGLLASGRRGLAGTHEGQIVLVLPGDAAGEVAAKVAHDLSVALGQPVTAGAAGPTSGPTAVAAYRQARQCLAALRALGRAGQGASAHELGFVGLLLGSPSADDPGIERFVRNTLGPVLDYDAQRGTDLVGSLAAYFANGANMVRTKDALHVHVNTVTQRLERVRMLLGEDWNSPERALEVQLALRLHQLEVQRPG